MAATARPHRPALRAAPAWTVFAMLVVGLLCPWRAAAAEPAAAAFMESVARDLLSASRSRSPAALASVIHRYGDTGYMGSYSLGSYRKQLRNEDRPGYLSGMVRFIGRYAANEAPKYPIASYKITGVSQGGQGIMVDSVINLQSGASHEVRWLLVRSGGSYRVRDAMVYGFWMLPFLRKLFENYIAENGGNVHALVVALNR